MPFESDDNVEINITVEDRDALQRLQRIKAAIDSLGAARPTPAINPQSTRGINTLEKSFRDLAKGIEESTKATLDNTEALDRGRQGFSNTQANVITFNQVLQATTLIFRQTSRAAGAFFDALDAGRRIEGLTQGFDNLQASVGNFGGNTLADLRTATQGLVSDLDLIESANQAVLLGVDDGTGKFNEYAAAAVKLGQATGRTTAQALNDLTTGIGRQSVKILDNLGIIVKAEAAYESFANKIGVSTDALTDSQKRLAFQEAVLESVRAKVAALGDIQETAGVAAQRLSAETDNLTSTFQTSLSSNQVLTEALQVFTERLADSQQGAQDLGNALGNLSGVLINTLSSAIAGSNVLLEEFIDGFRRLAILQARVASGDRSKLGLDVEVSELQALERAEKGARDFVAASKALSEGLGILNDDFELTGTNIGLAQRELAKLTKGFLDGGAFTQGAREQFKALQARVIELTKAFKALPAEQAKVTKQTKEQEKALKAAAREAQRITDAYEKMSVALQETFDGLTVVSQLNQPIDELVEALASGEIDGIAFAAVIEQIGRASGLTTEQIQKLKNELKDLKTQADKSTEGVNSIFTALENITDGFGDILVQDLKKVFDQIEGALAGGLQIAIDTGDFQLVFASIAEDIGGQLGSTFGPIGQVIGSEIGFQIGEIGTSLRDTLQGAGALLFGPTGFAVGDLVSNAFGSRPLNPSSQARNNFQDFFRKLAEEVGFETIFDEFTVDNALFVPFEDAGSKIAGALTSPIQEQLEDLDIPEDLFNQFLDLGTAFSQTFEGFGEGLEGVAGGLGQLLALNLQDPLGLNELQLLLERSGLSAEQFKASLEDAFFTGEISAQEFLTTSAAVQDLYEGGIPGAFGAFSAAFDNFTNFGLVSGQRGLDALGDIAVEAAQAGIDNFEDLQAELIANGQSAEQVAQLFDQLAAVGITTVDALANINLEQAATIISNLEALGFGFEELNLEIEGTIERIQQLRAETNQRIVQEVEVNVTVNDPDGGLEFIDGGGGDSFGGQDVQ